MSFSSKIKVERLKHRILERLGDSRQRGCPSCGFIGPTSARLLLQDADEIWQTFGNTLPELGDSQEHWTAPWRILRAPAGCGAHLTTCSACLPLTSHPLPSS